MYQKQAAMKVYRVILIVFFIAACPYVCFSQYWKKMKYISVLFAHADLVVSGKVIADESYLLIQDSVGTGVYSEYIQKYRIKVDYTYKGNIANDTIDIMSDLGPSTCSDKFERDTAFIYFCRYADKHFVVKKPINFLYTDFCLGTTYFNKKLHKQCLKLRR